MIINGANLLVLKPFIQMVKDKIRYLGTSFGLSEAGYDIRITESVTFYPPDPVEFVELCRNQGNLSDDFYKYRLNKTMFGYTVTTLSDGSKTERIGRFVLASSVEEFKMPKETVATIKDKSTWARQGLSVFNTVAEPGWNGFLTLELVFHGHDPVEIYEGQGIAQVLFEQLSSAGDYKDGKYQNAKRGAQSAITS